jgi:hypothetical protein
MKRKLPILLAAAASILVTALGYTAFLAGIHDPGPFQKLLQVIGLPFLSLAFRFDVEPSNLTGGLAIAGGAVLWFALFFAALERLRRRTAVPLSTDTGYSPAQRAERP